MKIWQPLTWALATGAVLLCGCASALAAAPAYGPLPPGGPPVQSRPASPALQGEDPQVVSPDGASQAPFIEVKDQDRISASAKNRPLDELLRILSQRDLFEIKGPVPQGEGITVEFSNLTLEQALKKLMRGYNYALLDQVTSRKPVLMVMGQVMRGASAEQGPSPQTPQPVTNQPRVPNGPPAPSPPPGEQPGPVPQRDRAPVPAEAQAGGTPATPPPGQVVQQQGAVQPQPNNPAQRPGGEAAEQPQQQQGAVQPQPNNNPPGVTNATPKLGGETAEQPQQQPPGQGGQTGEGGAGTGNSLNSSLPQGF